MGDEELVKKYFASVRHARSRGYSHLAEDFAGWRLKRLLEGTGLKQKHTQAFTDYLREELGRVGSAKEVVKKVQPLWDSDLHRKAYEPMLSFDLVKGARLLTEHQAARSIVILTAKWGMNQHEIAEVLGVTASRVSQILNEARKRYLGFKKEPS